MKPNPSASRPDAAGVGSGSMAVPEAPASVPGGEPDQWSPIDQAPCGIPIRVRDDSGAETVAIGDAFTAGGFFTADRSAPLLPFVPVAWAPLP